MYILILTFAQKKILSQILMIINVFFLATLMYFLWFIIRTVFTCKDFFFDCVGIANLCQASILHSIINMIKKVIWITPILIVCFKIY